MNGRKYLNIVNVITFMLFKGKIFFQSLSFFLELTVNKYFSTEMIVFPDASVKIVILNHPKKENKILQVRCVYIFRNVYMNLNPKRTS
jgi:hypothetical protein